MSRPLHGVPRFTAPYWSFTDCLVNRPSPPSHGDRRRFGVKIMLRSALLIAATAAAASAAPIGYVTSLGDFGGDASIARAIASSGSVAGSSLDAYYRQRAFLYDDGAAGDLESSLSQANSLNAGGVVAGTSYLSGHAQAVTWSSGARTVLGSLGGLTSEAMGINSAGVVVGLSDTASGQGHASLWSGGEVEDLGVLPGGSWSSAYAVNEYGQVVGYAMDGSGFFRAFVYNPGLGLTELGTLGGRQSYAFAVNDVGQIAGHASLRSGYLHAFLYSGGLMVDLGTLGGSQSFAYGINTSGDVVGYSWLAGSAVAHAFLYRNGVMTDLNSFIDPLSGWELIEAYDINDSGQIVGMGLYNGRQTAFRLDLAQGGSAASVISSAVPLAENPEPATMLLFAAGIVAVALRRAL